MLHLIIPPIIIVISAALLLLFLLRKISNLSEKESEELKKKSLNAGIARKFKGFDFSKVSKLALNFLEIATQRFKIIFLKFYNTFDGWFHSIREKRKKRDTEAGRENSRQPNSREAIFRKKKGKKFFSGGLSKSWTASEAGKVEKDKEREKESRPMISHEAARPEYQPAIKNKFEEILIKRIAANPRDLEAYERLGDYYIEQGNLEDALECYRQVLKLSPVNYKAKIKTKKLEKILGG